MAKDMRTWINQLEEAGELLRVRDKVTTDVDIGRYLFSTREKALLFDNVKGHPGWRVLGQAPANMRQVGLVFGAATNKIVTEFGNRIDGGLIKCKTIDSGPVQEVILKGKEALLRDIPSHVIHEKDPGRYIAGGLCIVKDPDTGIRNMALHRLMVREDNKLGILMHAGRHTELIYKKYEAMNKPMPMAVVIGHHPMYYFAAPSTGTMDLDEFEVTGALLEEPVELVKCETLDIEVPAYAEIILECEVLTHIREEEGPFCEFTDFYAAKGLRQVVTIKAITRRKDAIYKALQSGAFNEAFFYRLPISVALFQDLRNVGGYVDLKDVSSHWGGVYNVVIQMTPRFYGEAKHVLLAAVSSIYHHQKIAIAVDEDVDIYDPQDVAWALATRVNPETDVVIIPGIRGHPLDLSVPEIAKPGVTSFHRTGGKMIIDATKPPTSDPEERAKFDRARPPSPK